MKLSSFEELSRRFSAVEREGELEAAARAAQAGDYLGAVRLLDKTDALSHPSANRKRYGEWYAHAAKVCLGRREWQTGRAYLKRAVTCGHASTLIEERLRLLNMLERGEIKFEPDADWTEQFTMKCDGCPTEAPGPLECVRCRRVVGRALAEVRGAHLAGHYALGAYRWRGDPNAGNPLSRMIRWMKTNKGETMCRCLAYLLGEGLAQDTDYLEKADVITSVPPDPERLEARGFDNVSLVASNLASFTGIPFRPDALRKKHPTRDLRELSRSERRGELQGSFGLAPSCSGNLGGATVLLIDDVATTGTTLDLCAEVLCTGGCAEVYAATVAQSESSQASQRLAHGEA